jgi:hypothetical protein
MKKLLLAFAILGFVACGGESTPKEGEKDSTTVDAGAQTPAPAPTQEKIDTIKTAAGKDSLYIKTNAEGKQDTTKAGS